MGRLGPGHWNIQPWSVEEVARQVERRALGAVRSLQGGLARTAKKVRHLSNVSNAPPQRELKVHNNSGELGGGRDLE